MIRCRALVLYLMAGVLFCRILQYSWVTDDAFITFRSVMNFVSGEGPVFNIGERVQSFTHPLWFFLLSLGGVLDLNLYFFAIFLGLAFSLLTIWALFRLNRELGNDSAAMLLLGLGALAASESVVSFGTSGLENSLTYFLVVAATIASLRPARRLAFYLLVALALVNRLDALFFLAPLFVWTVYSDWRLRVLRLKVVAAGLLPLFAWHVFSVIYYGFLFPNTKYAKVGGRGFVQNAESGVHYLYDSMQAEWHTWLLIVLLPVLLFLGLRSRFLTVVHRPVVGALVAGMYMQIAYVVLIAGGDFMRGRFFTVVAIGASSALLFFRFAAPLWIKGALAVSCAGLFAVSAWIGAKERQAFMAPGVANERNFYKHTLALNLDPKMNYTNHPWAQQARELASSPGGVIGVNGQRAYWVPRTINLTDPAALTDAFIARSPILDSSRSGHFTHKIAEEYLLLKSQGRVTPEWRDKEAQALYENVRKVTESKELFSYERLEAMFWLWRRYGF